MGPKVSFYALTLALSAPYASVTQPAIPSNLEVPAGNTQFLVARAYGTQNYICLQTSGGFVWTFLGPQATLFDSAGQQIATHFLSPNPAEGGTPRATWQHSADTSAVWAAAIASSTDATFVADGAIPWLLLRTVGTQFGPTSGDTLSVTTYIQRVNTQGGVAPATGCKSVKDTGSKALVPYSTDYVFYKAG